MTPRVVFQMIVFNSDYVLPQVLESVLPYGKVIATEGPVRYWQKRGYTTSTDKTNVILNQYGIPTLHGQWPEKDAMVNAGLERIPDDTEYLWALDADEVWPARTIEKVLELLSTGIDSMSFKPYSFYGGFERIMGGFEEDFEWHRIQRWYPGALWQTHRPPTIMALDGKPWRQHLHLDHLSTSTLGLRFYHYSYVFPLQMRDKADYYHDMDPTGTIPNYFERVYLPWVTGSIANKAAVEALFAGVHNWLPARRGACLTRPFFQQPPAIESVLPELRRRWKAELDQVLPEFSQ